MQFYQDWLLFSFHFVPERRKIIEVSQVLNSRYEVVFKEMCVSSATADYCTFGLSLSLSQLTEKAQSLIEYQQDRSYSSTSSMLHHLPWSSFLDCFALTSRVRHPVLT